MKLNLVLLTLISLFIVSCGDPQIPLIKTNVVAVEIPIQPRPKSVNLNDIKLYVVTKENLNDFLIKFEKENNDMVFYAISVPDYENLAINIGELRRYINQQNSLILYYEDSIKRSKNF